ncbi:MAG: ion channel [Candidatus Eiseniibacteriota bacterium]
MLDAAALSLALVALTAFGHYEMLRRLNDFLPRVAFVPRRAKVLAAMLGAMVSHGCHIALFAAAYYVLRDRLGLGSLGGQFRDVFSSYYFSAETYTSLGLGDVYPVGQIRMVVGVEALTGLLMISWTASFTYLEMSRYWDRPSGV